MIPPSRTMTRDAQVERVWVRRAQEGDRAAFDHLVRRYLPRIYSIEFRLVGNHEDAEDLAQECFVRAWRSLGLFRRSHSFSAWLVRIAVHLSRDHHRRRGRRGGLIPLGELPEPMEPADPRTPTPSHVLGRRELQGELNRAIEGLPPGLREALVLRVFEGLEYGEIAEATGLRPGSVRTQVMKARRLLMRAFRARLEGGSE